MEGVLPKKYSKLLYSIIVEGKKEVLKNPCFTLTNEISLVALKK